MTATVTYATLIVEAPFTTNTFTAGDQLAPDVLGLSGGGFVSAYNNSSTTDGFILLNFYDADYNANASFSIPYLTANTDAIGTPVLTELANGNVLVVWEEDNALAPGGDGFKGAIFQADGTEVAMGIDIAGSGADYDEPSVTALAGGGFVVTLTWTGGSPGIYQAVYDSDATRLTSFVDVGLAGSQSDSHVTALAGGDFVVTWTDDSGASALIKGRAFGDDGVALGAAFTIGASGENSQSSVAAMKDGNFAVAYTDSGWGEAGTLGNGITLQIFDSAGVNLTPGTFIHVNTPGSADEVSPDVAVLANGFILVSWSVPFAPGDYDIYARIFDAAGNPVSVNGGTTEFLLTGNAANETVSAVDALLGGDFIVSWQDSGTDGSGGKITSSISELIRIVVGDASGDIYVGDLLRDSMDGGAGQDWLTGADGNDTLSGGDDNDLLSGGKGADLLEGGFDNDTIDGGDGADRIYGQTLADQSTSFGFDQLNGQDGNDLIIAASGDDIVHGGAGDDKVFGRIGADDVFGDEGDDKLKGGKGADVLQGGLDQDTLIGAGGDDTLCANTLAAIDGSLSGDTMLGGGGDDTATGSGGDDNILGGLGADTLVGRDGVDTISGGSGKDVITGGQGADVLTGGADKDIFAYADIGESSGPGLDLITDLANRDRIDLQLIDANANHGGNQAFTLVASFTGHAGELVVAYHTTGPYAGLTTIEGDINGDGVADMTITATGDHHTFTSFTL